MTPSNLNQKETVSAPAPARWPSMAQILRQIAVVAVIAVAWAALFAGYLHVVGDNIESETRAEATTVAVDAAPGEPKEVSYQRDVQPILDRRCVKCHGGEKTEEGLMLTTYDDTLNGSWNGPVVAPGRPADSLLVEQIENGEMPKKEPGLLPAEIRTIIAWVEAGAPDN